jgi:hypothetical protein
VTENVVQLVANWAPQGLSDLPKLPERKRRLEIHWCDATGDRKWQLSERPVLDCHHAVRQVAHSHVLAVVVQHRQGVREIARFGWLEQA